MLNRRPSQGLSTDVKLYQVHSFRRIVMISIGNLVIAILYWYISISLELTNTRVSCRTITLWSWPRYGNCKGATLKHRNKLNSVKAVEHRGCLVVLLLSVCHEFRSSQSHGFSNVQIKGIVQVGSRTHTLEWKTNQQTNRPTNQPTSIPTNQPITIPTNQQSKANIPKTITTITIKIMCSSSQWRES